MKYVDPDGRAILGINATFNMSSYESTILLGNSSTEELRLSGCYITTFANIFDSSKYYNKPLANSDKYNTPIAINNDKTLFAKDSGMLRNRKESMDSLFGEGNWDYWTKDIQGVDGLLSKLKEYKSSDKAYMIVGVFDLSDDDATVTNHMVGISELPDSTGNFTSGITGTSNGDYNRFINIRDKSAYNLDNLKEIRIIFLED